MPDIERPSIAALMLTLEGLAGLHERLGVLIDSAPRAAASKKVHHSDGDEHPAPGYWPAVAVRTDIHELASEFVKRLPERVRASIPSPPSTLRLLRTLASQASVLAEHEHAAVPWEIHDRGLELAQRAAQLLDPGEHVYRTPLGPCTVVDAGGVKCAGVFEYHWRQFTGTEEERRWRMANSRPEAVCNVNASHRIDAKLLGASRATSAAGA
jgi:hypothetical protein